MLQRRCCPPGVCPRVSALGGHSGATIEISQPYHSSTLSGEPLHWYYFVLCRWSEASGETHRWPRHCPPHVSVTLMSSSIGDKSFLSVQSFNLTVVWVRLSCLYMFDLRNETNFVHRFLFHRKCFSMIFILLGNRNYSLINFNISSIILVFITLSCILITF